MFLLLFYFGWIVITVPFSTEWIVSLKYLLAKGWYVTAFVFAPVLLLRDKRVDSRGPGLVFLSPMLCNDIGYSSPQPVRVPVCGDK